MQRQKRHDVADLVAERPGKNLILCDSLDRGDQLFKDLNVPFVHAGTTDRMETFKNNGVVIGSRVADEGLSLRELDVVIEYDFQAAPGGRRRSATGEYSTVTARASTSS